MPGPVVDDLRRLAEERYRDPLDVLERARERLAGAGSDPEIEAVGRWVEGLALYEVGRVPEAVTAYRRAAARARDAGLTDCEAVARASLAISLLSLGEIAEAEATIETALAMASASVLGHIQLLHGLVLQRLGRLNEALVVYAGALRRLQRAGDAAAIARLRLNRGILFAYRGDLVPAVEDLGAAEQISAEHHLPVLSAMAAHNMSFAHGRRGSLPEALAASDRARQGYAQLRHPSRQAGVLEADRAELMLVAGLVEEAKGAADAAVAALSTIGDLAHLSESRLLSARASLAQGDFRTAIVEASAAAEQFRASKRLPWAALADYVRAQAEVSASEDEGMPPPGLIDRARRIATDLEGAGWRVEALHVRTFVGRMALALGRPEMARTELTRAAAARRRGTADLRARAWHATALLRLAENDPAGARRALRRGMATVEEHRASLGATELRAHAAGHAADLARLGLHLAVRDGRPAELFEWSERWRAGALRQAGVRPPADGQLAADLAQIRALQSERRDAGHDGLGLRKLDSRIAALERAVRARARQAGAGTTATAGRLQPAALRATLGDRVLVEFVAVEGSLLAVKVTGRGMTVTALGPVADLDREVEQLRLGLRRLATSPDGVVGGDGPAVACRAARLDQMLVVPLALGPGPVVLVPTGRLHGLPWAALPSLSGRSLTVAPSAALWARDRRGWSGLGPDDGVALTAGPGLGGADREVRRLALLYPSAQVLRGAGATTGAVLDAFERARMAHVAAHGAFRADSPLFSSVLLADGPLTVYDLEALRSPPDTLVLSACDSATSAVRAGDELLGTAGSLLGLGVRWIVAPVLPVADQATADLMVEFHSDLVAGNSPATALARGLAGRDHADYSGWAARVSFVCIGGDDVPGR
ncbi:MAG: CHAT domain-containing protein [Acidimicrobiia bacterium]